MYTEQLIPVLRLIENTWRPRDTAVMAHPNGRFGYFQSSPQRNDDAAIVHISSGVQLTCRCVTRAIAEHWIAALVQEQSDDPEVLRLALEAARRAG